MSLNYMDILDILKYLSNPLYLLGNYIPLYSKSSLNLFQGTFIFYSELLNLLIIFIIFISLKQI